MVLVIAYVTGQSPLTCPDPGDEVYVNKPDLDALNTAACGLDSSTFLFTALVEDLTRAASCTTYCASCEADICGYGGVLSVG
jgi:hypothetical protein